jgi:glycosyltransferase involved in cell wall biosynthesis
VSVIVPARDADATLGRTLTALTAQELDGEFEVVVVDAGSRDGTDALARAAGAQIRVVNAGPAGPAEARNRGAAEARADVLAFTDADCFPEPDWLAQGLRAIGQKALVQGHVRPDPGAELGSFDRTVLVGGEAGLYETANLFVRRDIFEQVGGFEEWLRPAIGSPHMAEDLHFGWKVRRSGAPTAYCAAVVVNHAVFERGAGEFVAEYRRRRYFPDIAREVPELRREFFFARIFLSRQTAAFDLALLSLIVAARRRSALPLVGVVPYLAGLRGRGARVAAVQVVADAVGCWSLVMGSVRCRTPVL